MFRFLSFRLIAVSVIVLGMSSPSWADVTVSSNTGTIGETGTTTDSGTATFSVSGDKLTIVLTNTSSQATSQQGDALTGIGFSINGSAPTLSLSSIALTSGSVIWTAAAAGSSNTTDALTGSWTGTVTSSNFEYGVATTGANGNWKGGSISLGNASPDYGIVSPGTFPAASFSGSKFPFIQDSLTFTLSGATGLDLTTLGGFQFFFGTDGDYLGGGVNSVPEPSTFLVAAVGAIGFMGYGLRRRKS